MDEMIDRESLLVLVALLDSLLDSEEGDRVNSSACLLSCHFVPEVTTFRLASSR